MKISKIVGVSLIVSLSAGAMAALQDLFVSSEGTNSVKRYDGVTGAYLGDFVTPGSGGLIAPQGIQFGPDGHLYVSGGGSGAVHKYNGQTGASMGVFTLGYTFGFPGDFEFRNGSLFVSEFAGGANGGIWEFNGTTGALIAHRVTATGGTDGFVWDANGNFIASEWGSNSLKKYSSTGTFLGVMGSGGGLNGPLDLRYGAGGDLYVNSFFTGSVKRFDGVTGAYEGDFVTGHVRTQGQLIGTDGSLLVGDYATHKINRYDANSGAFLSTLVTSGSGGLVRPNNFTLNPVPEPISVVTMSLGLIALARRNRKSA